MDVELSTIHGYGQVLAKAVQSGKVSESLLNESVRRVLRDKFALGLFDNPYVHEDPVKIRAVASEGADLSQRLAAESVTRLKNERGSSAPQPRRREGRGHRTARRQHRGRLPGIHVSSGATDAAEHVRLRRDVDGRNGLKQCVATRRGQSCDEDRAAGLSECETGGLSLSQVLVPGSVPLRGDSKAPAESRRPTFPPQSPRPRRPTLSSFMSAATQRGPARTAPRGKARIPRISTCRRNRWS
jgi:hypothetical protein